MGTHWVRARRPLSRHELGGGYRTYHPGDWFEVKNQELRELVERGMVDTTPQVMRAEYVAGDAGVLARDGAAVPDRIEEYGVRVRHEARMSLPWERTLLLGPGAALTAESAVIGLSRVEAGDGVGWEMAAMLRDMRALARDVGSEAEQAKTLDLLGDLRLPVYHTGAVWVRRIEATEDAIAAWQAELDGGSDELHAFLRTIYTRRLLLCTLPPNWIGQWAKA